MDKTPSTPILTDLISAYPILRTLASYVSTIDLFHLSLTNRTHFSHILASQSVFTKLRQQCLCDGRGLAARQDAITPRHEYYWRMIHNDEEIEIRLWNLKCDAAGALPCRKCGINICEECRSYRRIPDTAGDYSRRPHLNDSHELFNVMCLCPTCDRRQEDEVYGEFLNEMCDCDTEYRWICIKCHEDEKRFSSVYHEHHTMYKESYPDDVYGDNGESPRTKTVQDHQNYRAFWCLCGDTVPEETALRCTWCMRRHLPRELWLTEYRDWDRDLHNTSTIDPDYPYWVVDAHGKYPVPYPKLGYIRPQDRGLAGP